MNTTTQIIPEAAETALAAENAALKAKLASLTGEEADEKLIRQKMEAGLSRDQARAAIRHQRDFDKRKAAYPKNV